MKHVFHQSPMTGQLEETRGFFIPAVKFAWGNISLRARTGRISVRVLVIVETRCIRTLRRTILIPLHRPDVFLVICVIHRKIKRLILQRRPSTKRIHVQSSFRIVVYEERGWRRGEELAGMMVCTVFQFHREHKDIFITTPILEGMRLLNCEQFRLLIVSS